MKRKSLVLIGLLLLSIVLVACGGPDTGGEPVEAPPEAAVEEADITKLLTGMSDEEFDSFASDSEAVAAEGLKGLFIMIAQETTLEEYLKFCDSVELTDEEKEKLVIKLVVSIETYEISIFSEDFWHFAQYQPGGGKYENHPLPNSNGVDSTPTDSANGANSTPAGANGAGASGGGGGGPICENGVSPFLDKNGEWACTTP